MQSYELFGGGRIFWGRDGGGQKARQLYAASLAPAAATRGDHGAKALRNPLVTTHAEIPSTSSGVGGF